MGRPPEIFAFQYLPLIRNPGLCHPNTYRGKSWTFREHGDAHGGSAASNSLCLYNFIIIQP